MTHSNGWSRTLRGMPREGAAAERSKTIGQQDIALFTELTGDRNPLHFDEDMARESLFGGLIVQGGVTSGILNALVAEDLPGTGSVFLGVSGNSSRPCMSATRSPAESKLPTCDRTSQSAN